MLHFDTQLDNIAHVYQYSHQSEVQMQKYTVMDGSIVVQSFFGINTSIFFLKTASLLAAKNFQDKSICAFVHGVKKACGMVQRDG